MLQDMREGKLCPETLSLWSEYIMLQSLFLLIMHEYFLILLSLLQRPFRTLSLGRREHHPRRVL